MENIMGAILDRVTNLENRVTLLERASSPPQVPAPQPVTVRPVAVTSPRPESPTPPSPKPEPAFIPRQESVFERMVKESGGWEELLGGNILNKLGALVLVIGIALFLSYSFANTGPSGRLFTSLGVSTVLLISGVLIETKERYRTFSRGLMAAGWAGLYFTSYAMYALPAARIIESPVVGTMLMAAVAVGMVAHSLRYQVQSLTALAFGCILAALALSPLNTFVAISLVPLAAAMLYLARRFDWQGIAICVAAGTYAVFLTRPESGASLASIQTMLLIFWAMFEGFDLWRLQDRKAGTPMYQTLFAVNALAGLGASAVLWYRMAPDSMWLFSSGAALLYLASTWVRFAIGKETYFELSLTLSAILTGLAIFARVPGLWMSVGLMLEAEALFLAAQRLGIPTAKVLSWFGFVAALRQISESFFGDTTVIGRLNVNDTTPPLVLMAALFYLNRYLAKAEPYWSYFATAFITTVAIGETRSDDWLGIIQLGWSALLIEFGLRKKLQEFRVQSFIVAFLSFGMLAINGLSETTANWPAAIGAVVFYIYAFRSIQWQEVRESQIASIGGSFATLALTMIFIHQMIPVRLEAMALMLAATGLAELGLRKLPEDLTWQARAFSAIPVTMALLNAPADPAQRITADAAVAALQFLMRFRARREPLSAAHGLAGAFIIAAMLLNEVSGGMLTLSWGLEGIALLAIGFATRDRWLRLSGLGLLLLCIAKVFFYDLRNLETIYRIFSFIGLGLILLAVSWIYTRFKEQLQKLL